MHTPVLYKLLLGLSLISMLIVISLWLLGPEQGIGPFLFICFVSLAVAVRGYPVYKGFSYTIWIFAAVTVAIYYPHYFTEIGGFPLQKLIVPLLQLIMFGMGTAMSLRDFAGVIQMPRAVLIGVVCQFSIMPSLGFVLAHVFPFPPEVAAGVVLIGCAPSGLASNVMAYLAKANLALSITITTLATLLSPLMTPLLMRLLADQYIAIDPWSMMWDIVKMVIMPIIAGFVFNKLLKGKAQWLDEAMPVVSMVGIATIITIITAAGRDSLMTIGVALVVAVFLHNTLGYLLGYWSARLLRLDEKSCRTVAIEVGMQNGGLASAIALQMGKVATVGLAPAVFGPLMNITGSSLATWWGGRSPEDEKVPAPVNESKQLST